MFAYIVLGSSFVLSFTLETVITQASYSKVFEILTDHPLYGVCAALMYVII